MRFCLNAFGWTMTALLLASPFAAAQSEEKVDFTRDVRPIFSNKCFQCHGPDQTSREGDLRLDTRDGAFALHDDQPVIVAGKPDESELLRRVLSQDPDDRMPPADSEYAPLTAKEKTILRNWIAQGAEWQDHWAFVPPQRPKVPVTEHQWPINEIDWFILRRLEKLGLEPAPRASREALIRRVTFDLTGLPPSVAEVDAFLADDSPKAYEKLVDRLLDSPRYGEHMARNWLDLARYGDTHGLHLDNVRSIWPYRDWLINAFNNNKPFDQMTIEQLAGDLLENSSTSQKVATGFIRCNVTTSEGGSIPEEYYVRYAVDRVETMGTVYMGLTLGCAVCHEHKFDPISQEEFYGLFAFFNSFEENPMDGNQALPPPFIEVPTQEQIAQRTKLQKELETIDQELRSQLAAIEYEDPYHEIKPEEFPSKEFVWIDDDVPPGAQKQQTGSIWEFVEAPQPVLSGKRATKRTASGLSQHFFTGAKPELIVGDGDILFTSVYLDPDNPPQQIMLQWNDGNWEHRAYWGGNHINWGRENSPSRKRMGDLPKPGEWVRLEIPVREVGLKPGSKINGWAYTQFGGTVYWDRSGLITHTPQAGQTFESQRHWELAIGQGQGLPKPIQQILKIKTEKRSEEQKTELRNYFLEHIYPPTKEQLAPWLTRRDQLNKELKALQDAIPKTMVVKELPKPKQAYLLYRGEYDKKRDPIERHLPSILPSLPEGAPLNRLGLAQWLVDPSHPLTARVTVNRFWQRIFGTGLVITSEDFGIQGDAPSHPELLDWLAVEFIESGWDVKHIQKMIVMSAAYTQSAVTTKDKLAKDPQNRYLSRGPRFRLDAEAIRDTALFVSGLLNEEIGGPSVKPYQPAGLWKAVGYTDSNTANFTQDDGKKLYRRSMYTFWKRTSPPPSMAVFDAPSRETCTSRRERTNTPLQALTLMNDKQFVEASRHFAQRILHQGGKTNEEKLIWAFRSATSRMPTSDELQILGRLLENHRQQFQADPDAATALIDSATTLLKPLHLDRDKSRDPELAAWTMLANLLLNLDETMSKG